MSEKNNGKKALRAGLGYTIGNVFCKGLSFISAFIFARLMSLQDYGIYNTFASYVAILAIVIGFALHVTIRNAKIDYADRLDEYCSSVSLLTVINSLILFIVAFVFREQLGALLSLPSQLVAIIVIESFANAVMSFYNDYLAVHFQSKKYLVISLIYAVGGTLLSVLLICTVCSDMRYFGRALGTAIPLLIIAIYILCTFYRTSLPRVRKEYWKYGLRISLPIIPHGLSQIILAQFDRIMIKMSVGDAMAGMYSFANNIGMIFQIITNSMDTAWTPWFFERMEAKDYKAIRKASSLYLAFVSILAVGMLLISPELIVIMGGETYRDSRYVVLPLLLSVFFAFMYTLPSNIEYYYKKTQIIAFGTMGAAVLNIILNSIFVPMYGYVAAAYTTVFCYVCYFVVHMIISTRIQGSMIFDLRVIIGCAVAVTAAMFICLWLINEVAVRMTVVAIGILAMLVVVYLKRDMVLPLVRNLKK